MTSRGQQGQCSTMAAGCVCVRVRCQETGSHPSLVSSVFPDGRVTGRGGLMKGRVPQGDTHSPFRSSSSQRSQVIPGLYWDSWSQRRISACWRHVPMRRPDEFNNSQVNAVSASVKVLRRGHSSVNTCFFERKLLASDISL